MQNDPKHMTRSLFAAFILIIGFGVGLYAWDARLSDMNGAKSVSSIAPAAGDETETPAIEIGASYNLVDHNGEAITQDSYPGQYKAVFFGFTNCPDVCPTELQKLAIILKSLGDDSNKIQTLFITTDPARDTPDVMKDYVVQFHPSIAGLTGTDEQVQDAIDNFRAYAEKASEGSEEHYLINHSAFTYFMSPDNELITVFSPSDSPEDIQKEIKSILLQG